ncbi:oligosaccharide flippase family protein [Sporofaciens sp. JLR.KK001]|uniref:oligosaccharide flippase family protein n=1 Tax=Sporofaciens sp. JLR.KK001 TaxID=3112621 RepID=UPI002FF1FCD9
MKVLNKKESFFETVMHIGAGTIINMVIGFISTPIFTRLVEPDEYGKLNIFTLYIGIAVMVLCLGLDQAMVRFYYHDKSISYKRWLVSVCVIIPIIVFSIVCIAFEVLLATDTIVFEFTGIRILFYCGVFCEILFRFASLLLRLEGNGKYYSIASIIYKSSYVIVAVIIIELFKRNDFLPLAIGLVMGYLMALAFSTISYRDIWFFWKEKTSISVKISELLTYSLPFILSMGLTTLFEAIDKLSLKYLCDYSVVGIYSSATTLIAVFAIVQSSFNAVWAPTSVKHYEEAPEDRGFYTRYNITITVIMFVFGMTFILCKDVFGLLLGIKYREAAQIIPFLALHPIMYTISETTVTGVVVKKKSYVHIIIAAIVCVVNFVGNMLLIPYLGAKGAAISTGLSYVAFYSLRTGFGNRYYWFDHKPLKFWLSAFLSIIYAVYNTFFEMGIVSVVLYLVIVAAISFLYRETIRTIISICLNKIKRRV